jgi:hypothetical protein
MYLLDGSDTSDDHVTLDPPVMRTVSPLTVDPELITDCTVAAEVPPVSRIAIRYSGGPIRPSLHWKYFTRLCAARIS